MSISQALTQTGELHGVFAIIQELKQPRPVRIKQKSADVPKAEMNKDRLLVAKILNGDEKAFTELYREYSPGILRRLYRMTGDSEYAEDCLQQVFTEALRSFENYRGEGSLQGWLNRIATHLTLDHFRRKQRLRSFLEDFAPAKQHSEQEPLPEELFLKEELRQLIRSLLEKLGARKRMAILLCDLEGMGVEEAAEQMDIPVGTVASRLHHGRRDLRKLVIAELRKRGLSVEDWLHR